MTHIDSAQTDSFADPIPRGTFHIDPAAMPRVPGGPVNIITMASTSPQYMWVSSSSGVRYVDVSNGGFRQVASLDTPGLPPISTQDLDLVLNQKFDSVEQIEAAIRDHWGGVTWKRLSNGVYGAVDKDNELYYVTQNAEVLKFKLKEDSNPAAGIEVEKRYDFAPYLGKGMTTLGIPESIVGVSMTYDGHLLVQSNRSLSVLDRGLDDPPIQQIRFGEDETVSNSIAVDDKNGIYVASDKLMRKVVWTGSKLSTDEYDGAWSSPYDFGRQPPAVKFGIGTGSTPTLMGFGKDSDELVVITDGADRMKLVAFWRNKIPDGFQQKPGAKSNRIADQIQVTAGLKEPLPEFIQSEQSVVVNGYGAFVVQNIGAGGAPDRLVDVLANGPVSPAPQGVQRFEWDPKGHRWASAWARGDVVSTSMVPAVSTSSGIIFLNGYTKADGWEVTGLDWKTGETVHRTIFGQSNLGNGAYALIEGLPNGDLLFNSVGGPFRAKIVG
ncbi:hypothetical protein FJK96_19275 [Mycobacteroides chelonae]|uniref:Uncharacterized protein n=1 Tax=Mycobacteroides chelonae TaxID=1774 RepID=A0AB73UAY7_MYCCH|nr:hypothetical protein BKG57_10120 [Mycobacteroides chelonae]QDF73560.1 hypothetical protein FJK96_19275 [Mycobacteroides chelonae]